MQVCCTTSVAVAPSSWLCWPDPSSRSPGFYSRMYMSQGTCIIAIFHYSPRCFVHQRYSLCYGEDVGKFIGLPQTFYMFKNTYGQAATHLGASTIPSSIAAMYELGFALVTPAIIASSLAGLCYLTPACNGYYVPTYSLHFHLMTN